MEVRLCRVGEGLLLDLLLKIKHMHGVRGIFIFSNFWWRRRTQDRYNYYYSAFYPHSGSY
jgi:hypothetical protein